MHKTANSIIFKNRRIVISESDSNMILDSLRERDKAVLFLGVAVRVLLGVYTSHGDLAQFQISGDFVFIGGFNPMVWNTLFGPGFYALFLPSYSGFLLFNSLGFYNQFLLDFLFRLPMIVGDVVAFICLRRISMAITHNENRSFVAATAYFLNPAALYYGFPKFTIDSLMITFVLLSFLHLSEGKIRRSAFYLAFATSIKFIPILLAPFYIIYLWRGRKPSFSNAAKFLKVFLLSSSIFFAVLLSVYVPLYISSPAAFLKVIQWPFGGGLLSGTTMSTLTGQDLRNVFFGFTGILDTVGLWASLDAMLHQHVFLFLFVPLYLFLIGRELLRPSKTSMSVNRYTILVFSILLLANPIGQPHFLMWVLPFLFLACYTLCDLPSYYVNLLWIINIATDYFVGGGSSLSFLANSYPNMVNALGASRPLSNLFLQSALGVVYSLIVVVIIIIVYTKIGNFKRQET